MTVTAALFVCVLVLGTTTWRLLIAERARSEARVESLAAAIDAAGPDSIPHVADGAVSPTVDAGRTPLFTAHDRRPSRAPIIAAAGGLVLLVFALLIATDSHPGASRVETAAVGAPLELLSVQHALAGETLIVNGLVRNPGSAPARSLTVVVSALDSTGTVIARGQAPLDPDVLAPGRETSFRVTVAQANRLGRYRVGFTNGDGVVPHIDRRGVPAQTAMGAGLREN
jgi:hypothetical protein